MSIRTRLTFWYTGLLAISLLVFGVLLYSAVASLLVSLIDDRLESQAQDVISLIRAENDPLAVVLSGRAKLPSIDVFASQYYIQILQSDGRAVQLSENLQGRRLPVPPQITSEINNELSSAYTVEMEGGARLRVYSLPIMLAGRPAGAVQVGQSMSPLEESLVVVRRALVIGSVLSLLLAAAGGAALARAALRPIQAITETTQQISRTEDLDRRIPVLIPDDELGRLSSTINDMLGRLEQLFETQQRLVADVSHELRTPLTTIQGNLDLLRRGAMENPASRSEALHAIEDETARMRRMVSDLLLLAQADAGLKLHFQPVELDTLLLEVYRQSQVMARGVAVRLGAEDQALVLGDADRLRQVLLNLLDNAIKYTPDGGEVTLTLKRAGKWVQVSVVDTGIGISPADLPHIFDRFYRADPSRSRSGGSGLGLAIAQWVVEAHGGRLEVESKLGEGSCFTLWLPELTADGAQKQVKID